MPNPGSSDQVIYLSLPTQTAPKATVDGIVDKLHSMSLSKQDAIIVDIFSSTALMGSDEMGMPVPAFQTEPGRYHITGCLEIAPEGVLKKRFGAVRPILEVAGEAVKVCLLPIPRYVKRPCCKEDGHITNFMEADFEDILVSTASTCRNIVSGEGEKARLSLFTFDPVSAFGGGPRLISKTSTAGLSVWQEEDPVHLTSSAYKDIASLVQNQAELAVQGKPAAGRRRIDSIVTSQLSATTPNIQEPGLISGTENERGGFGRGGGGSCGFGRGQWNRGRGRGNRNFPY